MTALIISIIALVLALYIGFKRKREKTWEEYIHLSDLQKHHIFIKYFYYDGKISGMYLIKKTSTSILGKERKEVYLKLVFRGTKKSKTVKL